MHYKLHTMLMTIPEAFLPGMAYLVNSYFLREKKVERKSLHMTYNDNMSHGSYGPGEIKT